MPEFVDWGPCSLVTGRPIPSRKGEYFQAWLAALKAIGFRRIEYRILCAADYGDPTTRRRFILIATSDGRRLRWPEPTHAEHGSADLLGSRNRWRAAAEIIDWNLRGSSIFTRRKPLAEKTLRRIERKTPPVDDVPAADRTDAWWVTPRLVGEVSLAGRTRDQRVRQAAWRGWRPDKEAGEVRWEV